MLNSLPPNLALLELSLVTQAGPAESWRWRGLVFISFKNLHLTLSMPLAKFSGKKTDPRFSLFFYS